MGCYFNILFGLSPNPRIPVIGKYEGFFGTGKWWKSRWRSCCGVSGGRPALRHSETNRTQQTTPRSQLTLSSCVSRNLSKYNSKIFHRRNHQQHCYPFGTRGTKPWDASFHQELLPMSTIFLETQAFFGERWMDGYFLLNIKTHGNCGCFFNREVWKKCKPWKKKMCCQQKIFRDL